MVLKTTCAPDGDGGVLAAALAAASNDLVVKELRVCGSRCGPFDQALELLARPDFDVAKYLEAEYGLDEVEAALAHAGRRGTLKIQLVMGGGGHD